MIRSERNRRTVIVGIFIAIGLIILIAGILTLGGQQKVFAPSIKLHAVFSNVNGLLQGDNVFFSGVKIGTVRDVEFQGNAQVRVTMQIERRVREYIRKDAKAKIGAEGFIGNRTVVIYEGSAAAPPVEGGEQLRVEETASAEDMMATLQKNNENLVAITNDFKIVSQRLAEGEGTIGALLTNDALFKQLQATAANLQVAARNSEAATRSIADYTAKLQQPGTLAEGLVNDTVIMRTLQQAVAQIQQAATDTRRFTQNLQQTSEQLKSDDNAVGVLLNDPETAAQLREIIANLNSSSVKLDENLEALQHNFLFRGFFRRRARQEEKERKEAQKQAEESARRERMLLEEKN